MDPADRAVIARLESEPRFAERYAVARMLGRGGMGLVALATDKSTGRAVAVKVLAGDWKPDLGERFMREGRLMAKIVHPNVLLVYDLGVVAGLPYLVTELAPNGSLRDLMARDGRFHLSGVGEVMAPVCWALQAIHDMGVVHRDLKPDNILFADDRQPRVADFGLAALQGGDRLTVTGQFVGSLMYSAPDVITSGDFSPACDIYAAGVVLFEMLSGALPFRATTVETLVRQIVHDRPDLTPARPDLPAEAIALVHRCLAKKPEDRPASAAELAKELEGWASGRVRSSAAPSAVVVTRSHGVGRARGVAAAAALGLAGLGAVFGLRAPPRPATPAVASASAPLVEPDLALAAELATMSDESNRQLALFTQYAQRRAASMVADSASTELEAQRASAPGIRERLRARIAPLKDARDRGERLSRTAQGLLARGVATIHFYWWLETAAHSLLKDGGVDPRVPENARRSAEGLALTREYQGLILELTADRPALADVDVTLLADLVDDTRGVSRAVTMESWGPEERARLRQFEAAFLRDLGPRGPVAEALAVGWTWGSRLSVRKADRDVLTAAAARMRELAAELPAGAEHFRRIADDLMRDATPPKK